MVENIESIQHVCNLTGKPVIILFNRIDGIQYIYLLDTYKAYNPGSHIYEHSFAGKDIRNIIQSVNSFSAGFMQGNDDVSILQKIDSLKQISITFPNSEHFPFIRIN